MPSLLFLGGPGIIVSQGFLRKNRPDDFAGIRPFYFNDRVKHGDPR